MANREDAWLESARLSTKPLRIKNALANPVKTAGIIKKWQIDQKYRELALEYKKLTGKHFKRNGYDMYAKRSKLEAIKIRIRQIQDMNCLKSALADNRKKHGPDFTLLGAL